MSALTAAGPVTASVSPVRGTGIAARMAVTASRSMSSEWAGPVMFTLNRAALPSAEGSTGPGAASPVTWPSSRATAARAAATVAWSADVSGPFSAAKTTTAALVCGCPAVPAAASCSTATLVEAAEAGR